MLQCFVITQNYIQRHTFNTEVINTSILLFTEHMKKNGPVVVGKFSWGNLEIQKFYVEKYEIPIDVGQGYIAVGDGCWRPNVLVISLRCW